MKIAILGAGNVGMALARNWAEKGHEVLLGVRDPAKKSNLADTRISVHPVAEACEKADTLLISLPVNAIVETLKRVGDLQGKVLIDATNSVFGKPDPYATGYHAAIALTEADVAKGFNSTGYENMADPVYPDGCIDMFTAGASVKAKKVVNQLSRDAGFAMCYDFGGEDKVELLEQLAMCWINLAIIQNEGRGIAFKIVTRKEGISG